MANESLIVGNSNWAVKANNLLGYAVGETSGYYVPRELDFTRNSTATYTDENGIIQTAAANIARVQDNALLLEPQRTNLLLRSEEFDNAYWRKLNLSVLENVEISPDGLQNADKIIQITSSPADLRNDSASITSGVDYTWSVYAKNAGFRYIRMTAWTADDPVTIFDLDNISVISEAGPAHTSKIEDAGNGWRRLIITRTSTSTSAWLRLISLSNPIGSTSNGVDGAYIWGAQLEQGSYATSYIKTTSAWVTRLADSCSKTGISSLIGQTEGTLFVEVDTAVLGDVFSGLANRRFLTISDNSLNNRILIQQKRDDDAINFVVINSNVVQADISTSSNQSGIKKIAVGYANNDFVMYVNGVQIGTDTSGSVPICSRVGVGSFETSANTSNAACPVYQVSLFTTRLSNSELASMTTL